MNSDGGTRKESDAEIERISLRIEDVTNPLNLPVGCIATRAVARQMHGVAADHFRLSEHTIKSVLQELEMIAQRTVCPGNLRELQDALLLLCS